MHSVKVNLWSFCLLNAVQHVIASWWPPAFDNKVASGALGAYPIRTYATSELITSPQTNWLQWHPRCEDGRLYFLAPRGASLTNPGPMILDSRGDLVWSQQFDNDFGGQAYNFRKQTYLGTEYLTFWSGDDSVRGHGAGWNYMLDSTYNIVHTFGAANGLSADLHEFLITPEGTALLSVYDAVPYDVTTLPGWELPEEPFEETFIWDGMFQEIDIATGDLLFEWRASDHLNVTEAYRLVGSSGVDDDPFDWFHINSIDKDELGNYLISARFTHSVTYIDGKSGAIIWTLGGVRNDFMDLSGGSAIDFAWQHDARFLPADSYPQFYQKPEAGKGYNTLLLTLFDNAAQNLDYDYGADHARGLLLEVTFPTFHEIHRDTYDSPFAFVSPEANATVLSADKINRINGTNPAYTARLIQSYDSPENLRSSSQGSFQYLPATATSDAKFLAGFGVNAIWAEYDANGTLLCDAHFAADTTWENGEIQSYRSFKFEWTGTPEAPPAVALSGNHDVVYVSWNGATEVREWLLQCADADSADGARNTEDGGDDEDDESDILWEDIAILPKEGFETTMSIPDTCADISYVRVLALDAEGLQLPYGISATLHRSWPVSYYALVVDTMSPRAVMLLMLSGLVATIAALGWFSRSRGIWPWRYVRPRRWSRRVGSRGAYHLLTSAS